METVEKEIWRMILRRRSCRVDMEYDMKGELSRG